LAPSALDCFTLIDVDRRATTSLAMTCFVVSTSSRSAKGAVAICPAEGSRKELKAP
jgi:hypothetical protein